MTLCKWMPVIRPELSTLKFEYLPVLESFGVATRPDGEELQTSLEPILILKEFSISAYSTVNRFAGWAVLYVMPMNRGRGNISLGGYRDETEAPV
jgi:hypothetical protein